MKIYSNFMNKKETKFSQSIIFNQSINENKYFLFEEFIDFFI